MAWAFCCMPECIGLPRIVEGDVEGMCRDCWARVPRRTRLDYLQARRSGATQMGDGLRLWALCRKGAETE